MSKKTLSAKVSPATIDRVEDYASEKEISKSEATQRLLIKGLDFEDTNSVILQTDGGQKIENQIGEVQQKIEQQSENYEQKLQVQNYQMLLIALGLFWIALHLVFDVGGLVTVLTGIPVGLGLFYVTFVWGDGNE